MGSLGSQNGSKARQNPQPEPEKKNPPSGADKFFELFVKAAKKDKGATWRDGSATRISKCQCFVGVRQKFSSRI